MREAIPDRFAFAIFIPRTFDLVRGGGRAPKKILGKFYFRGVSELVTRARKRHNARGVRGIRRHAAGRKQPGRERGGHACGKSRTRKFTAGQAQGGMRLLRFQFDHGQDILNRNGEAGRT